MQERTGNIWSVLGEFDAICVTTNGIVKLNGELTMGRGIAQEASNMFPGLAKKLGKLVKRFGNIPLVGYKHTTTSILSFPTKNHWRDNSSLELIDNSAHRILVYASILNWQKIALPRPGCGLGKLDWNIVKPILSKVFDDRFYVYSR